VDEGAHAAHAPATVSAVEVGGTAAVSGSRAGPLFLVARLALRDNLVVLPVGRGASCREPEVRRRLVAPCPLWYGGAGMGQPEQFTKRTFASDAELVTGGAVRFQDPPESSLTWVKADGLLVVQKPEALLALPPPWSYAQGHPQVVLEVKMPRDPINAIVLDRMDLRRLARQIQRAEDPKEPWIGEQALWALAAYLPDVLEKRRTVTKLAPGCYRVGPHPFDYIWIAAPA
jgi:hypothetical protein